VFPSPLLKTEADPLSETFGFLVLLELRMMGKVQTPSDSECYTSSSELIRIYLQLGSEHTSGAKTFMDFVGFDVLTAVSMNRSIIRGYNAA
jgi:hypothetical protein